MPTLFTSGSHTEGIEIPRKQPTKDLTTLYIPNISRVSSGARLGYKQVWSSLISNSKMFFPMRAQKLTC